MEYWARIIVLIIDTHAHVFSSDERQFPPRENPSRPPKGAGSFAGLLHEVEQHDISAVTLVQVSGFYGFDNRYVCAAARENPHWTAGICTLDPEDERSPGLLKTYARESNVRGMRSIPASGKRLDHPGVRALWKTAADLGLVINILGGYELEEQIETLLKDFPGLRVVLDHSLGLAVGAPNKQTLATLGRLAKHRNLYNKISFIANGPQGCPDSFPCSEFHETVLKVIEMFGAERCAWGSHYPTVKYAPKLTYGQHLEIYRKQLPLSDDARRCILGETARRLWFPEMDATASA